MLQGDGVTGSVKVGCRRKGEFCVFNAEDVRVLKTRGGNWACGATMALKPRNVSVKTNGLMGKEKR